MALRQIREEHDPILRKISKEVKEVTPRMKQLIEDMKETMYHANGVGLAAPQVGILKRIILVDVDMEEEDLHVFINPVIVEEEGLCNGTEGCLSVPGEFGYVDRPEKIKLEYMDEDGNLVEIIDATKISSWFEKNPSNISERTKVLLNVDINQNPIVVIGKTKIN